MYQTIMQSIFITTIAIMIIGLVAPAFASPTGKAHPQPSKFVIPIDKASDARQDLTVSHLETLLQHQHMRASDIVLVAYAKGIYLLEKGNHFQARVQALIDKGVQCYACETTRTKIETQLASRLNLLDGVKGTVNGQQYVEALMEQGYVNSFA